MATWGRAHAIKAALVVIVMLVILLNLYSYRLETKLDTQPTSSFLHINSAQWPRRTYSSNSVGDRHNAAAATKTVHSMDGTTTLNSSVASLGSSSQLPAVVVNSSISVIGDSVDALPTPRNSSASDNGTALPRAGESPAVNITTNDETKQDFFQNLMTTLGINTCPPIPPDLEGPVQVDKTADTMEAIDKRLHSTVSPGGFFQPKECNARDRVAIVVPYRDRATHLPIFLKNMHPFLIKQQIDYGIFIVEQTPQNEFNRATLMNVGFLEALKLKDWDCFIFHDVDLLPMDDRNLYTCPDQPRHMSVAVDTLGYKLPYSSIFGGVSAMTVKQFRKVNGFSNAFWGWGGEDDDMSNRLKHYNYHIARYPINVARYTMLSHKKEKANPKRYEKLQSGVKRYDVDGINSVKYRLVQIEKRPLYTWLLVDIKPDGGS